MKHRIHKMRKRLWLYFAAAVFIIMLASSFCIMTLAFLLYRSEFFVPSHIPMIPLAIFLLLSIVIATIISIIVGRKILRPLEHFSDAAGQVATGDFSLRVDERSSVPEVRHFARHFNMMVHDLGSLETLRNDFVNNISHEFKTPIATIEGYATLLQEPSLSDAERTEYTAMLMASTRQLSELSGNILSLARLENQDIVLNLTEFRLDEQVREALLLLEKEWSAGNIQLKLDLAAVRYTGDAELLLLVWRNLIENAIKFSADEAVIEIQLEQYSRYTVFRITDHGCGMTPEVQKHVFDKFYQGDTTRKTAGNGLGLALVHKIVTLHDGTIQLISAPDQGCTFIVSLPHQPE